MLLAMGCSGSPEADGHASTDAGSEDAAPHDGGFGSDATNEANGPDSADSQAEATLDAQEDGAISDGSDASLPDGDACVSCPVTEDIQYFELNESKPGKQWRFSFVQLTDLHIGEGVDDYGTPGFDDQPPDDPQGYPVDRLREGVRWVNQNVGDEPIAFVLVTGDFTDSGERSEMLVAKELLDELVVPYVPVIGNHDLWPYTDSEEAPEPVGDVVFRDVFAPVFSDLAATMPGWNDGTRMTAVANPEHGGESNFQNFWFEWGSYVFVCTDFVTRSPAMIGSGCNGEADLHDFDGGTWRWLTSTFWPAVNAGDDNILIVAHHPLTKDPWNGFNAFSYGEYGAVTSFLNDNGNKDVTGLWLAGHVHRNHVYGVSTLGIPPSTVCPGVETAALKEDNGHLRVIRVWDD